MSRPTNVVKGTYLHNTLLSLDPYRLYPLFLNDYDRKDSRSSLATTHTCS